MAPLVLMALSCGVPGEKTLAAVVQRVGAGSEDYPDLLGSAQTALDDQLDFVLSVRRTPSPELHGCGSNDSCVFSAMRRAGVEYLLTASVSLVVEPPLLSVRLYLAEQAEVRFSALDLHPIGRETPNEITSASLHLLKASGFEVGGGIEVNPFPASASVLVRTATSAHRGRTHLLPVGTYEVDTSMEGYIPAHTTVEVTPGTWRLVSVTLQEDASLWRSPLVWVGVGVASIAVISALVIAVQGSGRPSLLCQAHSPAECEGMP